jgi:hypothetical protein
MGKILEKIAMLKGNPTLKRVYEISSVVLSVMVGLLGIAFAFSCMHIYFTNPAPAFTREGVGVYLTYLTIPSIIVVLTIIAVWVMKELLAEPKQKIRAEKDSGRDLRRIYEKNSFYLDNGIAFGYGENLLELGENKEKIKKSMAVRFALYAVAALQALIFAALCLAFAVNFNRFDLNDINGDVISASVLLFPLVFIALAFIYVVRVNTHKLKAFEVELLRTVVKEKRAYEGENITNPYKALKHFDTKILPKIQNVITVVILALGLVFVILGSQNGGMAAVLEKAVRICTECIGLG